MGPCYVMAYRPSTAHVFTSRAARAFDRGVSAIDNHDYKAALESFKTAYELMPHWRVLAHIGLPQPDAYRWKG